MKHQHSLLKNVFTVLLSLLIQLSTAISQQPDYYRNVTHENYRKVKAFNDTIELSNLDPVRLNAVLYFATNEVRAKHNLAVLAYSPELEEAAGMHSCDMVVHHFFSHNNPVDRSRETPNDRAQKAGIINPFIAENIAEEFVLQYKSGSNVYEMGKGNFSYQPEGRLIPRRTYLSLAESLIERWMNSPVHRKNILSPDALQVGCGTCFFNDPEFNDMPTLMATQNFQWFEKTKLQQK